MSVSERAMRGGLLFVGQCVTAAEEEEEQERGRGVKREHDTAALYRSHSPIQNMQFARSVCSLCL